jgi:hypothetical protein
VPSPSRSRSVAIWAVALAVPGMALFAWLGSIGGTVIFAPAAQPVAPAGIGFAGLTATTFGLIGGLIAARTRHNVVGGLLLGIGGCIATTLACMTAVAHAVSGAQWLEWLTSWVSALPFALVGYLLLLYPTGHLVTHRWRPALWLIHVTVVAIILGAFATPYTADNVYAFENPSLLSPLTGSPLEDSLLAFILIPIVLTLTAMSFVARYRTARGVERAQLKWFAFASAVVVVGYLVQNALWLLTGSLDVSLAGIGFVVLVLSFNAVPIASGLAITRYRLYDIDRVVSRTIAYLLVTGVVLVVYVAVIAMATAVLYADSTLVVAAATLLAASSLEPSRRRIQSAVDRRFNRAHYDAMGTLDAFGARLTREIDPTAVSGDLLDTVARALQPASAVVWTVEADQAPSFHMLQPGSLTVGAEGLEHPTPGL